MTDEGPKEKEVEDIIKIFNFDEKQKIVQKINNISL